MSARIFLILLAGFPLAAAAADRYARIDANGDGVLSRAELERALPRIAPEFERIDRDGDGRVSRTELAAHLQRAKSRPRMQGEGGFAAHFQRADADGDGVLSRAECERNLPRLALKFDRIDFDRDGTLSRAELNAWFDARRAARGRAAG